MGLSIVSNIGALSVARHLQRASQSSNKGLERLASGLRINSSKDDAAGAAISQRMSAQIRGLSQANRNANDAISVAKTADGALQETTNLLQRIRELAVQSANDTMSTTDRAAVDTEVQALLAEIDAIAAQTTFNGINLLDGSFASKQFHVGGNTNETLSFSISNLGTSSMGTLSQITVADVQLTQLPADELTINGVSIGDAEAADDTVSSGGNLLSAIAKAAQINRESSSTNVTATVLATQLTGAGFIEGGILGPGQLSINGVGINGAAIKPGDVGGQLQNSINSVTDETGVTASVSVDGNLILSAADGRNIRTNVDAAVIATIGMETLTQAGGLQLDSPDGIVIGGTAPEHAGFTAGTFGDNVNIDLSTLSLGTQTNATNALINLDKALLHVATNRASLGASLNQLDSVVNTLSVATENSSSARSQIRDADWAMETALLSKAQILQQAATSMALQANVTGRLALQLLES